MESLIQDVRFAARSLRRTPGFALAAVLTLALGIGAGTTVFSAAQALLMRPLPFRDAERLAEVSLSTQGGTVFVTASDALRRAVAEERRVVQGVAGTLEEGVSLRAADGPGVANGVLVTDDYFGVMGVRPGIGRWPAAIDEAAISHPLWKSRFGGDPAVLGSTVRINGQPFRLVGVAPAELTAAWIGDRPEVWLSIAAAPRVLRDGARRSFGVNLVARLRPGVTHAQAEAALTAVVRANRDPREGEFAPNAVVLREVSPMSWTRKEDVTGALWLLALATSLVLLAACVNVAGILAARATARARDTALRMSLGATRARVVGGIVAEAMLLTLAGAAAGVLLSTWFGRLLMALPWPEAVAVELVPDARVWAFALALALVTGAAISIVPVLQTASADVVPLLKGTTELKRGGRGWMRGALVSAQIALSLLLLLGAGLFMRALDRAWSVDPGFDPAGVLTTTLDLSPSGYDPKQAAQFFDRLQERARALPGVESAALSMNVPFSQANGGMIHASVPGHTPKPGEMPFVMLNAVSSDFFRTLRLPVLTGRGFTAADENADVAVVSEALAARYWPDGNVLGKSIMMGAKPLQVIGVVREAKLRSLGETPNGLLYLPLAQAPTMPERTLNVRVREGQEGPVAAALAAEVRRLDREVPLPTFRSLRDLIGDSLLAQRLGALLVGAFGAAGLLLACVGVYGAMSYTVGQRTREIGVRMALGAQTAQVLKLVLGQGVVLAAAGIGAGLVAAVAATRVVGHLLYGVSATDPLTFATVSLLLAATTLVATYLPARRAARVDPMVALRSE
ncbi:MAG TPA: ABC transporter permease [Longimicrobium sp.]|jgi:predicted permease